MLYPVDPFGPTTLVMMNELDEARDLLAVVQKMLAIAQHRKLRSDDARRRRLLERYANRAFKDWEERHRLDLRKAFDQLGDALGPVAKTQRTASRFAALWQSLKARFFGSGG
jgi:hypothetical protein